MSRRAAWRRAVPVAVSILAACGGTNADGGELPDVEVESLDDGTTSSLADIEGPAVINLWATWCGPCRREIPEFEAVHQERGHDVTFVGVNVGESAADAAEFIAEVGASYSQYLDPDGYVSTELGATTMPMTVVTGPDGEIASRHQGEMSRDELEAAIDAALG